MQTPPDDVQCLRLPGHDQKPSFFTTKDRLVASVVTCFVASRPGVPASLLHIAVTTPDFTAARVPTLKRLRQTAREVRKERPNSIPNMITKTQSLLAPTADSIRRPRSRLLTLLIGGSALAFAAGCSDRATIAGNETNEEGIASAPPSTDNPRQDSWNSDFAAGQSQTGSTDLAGQSTTPSAAAELGGEWRQDQQGLAQSDQPSSGTTVAGTQQTRQLEQRIRTELRNDQALDLPDQQLDQIQIQIDQTRVTLSGEVSDQQAIDYIEQRVRQIQGVSSVDNQLQASD